MVVDNKPQLRQSSGSQRRQAFLWAILLAGTAVYLGRGYFKKDALKPQFGVQPAVEMFSLSGFTSWCQNQLNSTAQTVGRKSRALQGTNWAQVQSTLQSAAQKSSDLAHGALKDAENVMNRTQVQNLLRSAAHKSSDLAHEVLKKSESVNWAQAIKKAAAKLGEVVGKIHHINWTAIAEIEGNLSASVRREYSAKLMNYHHLMQNPSPGSLLLKWSCVSKILVVGGVGTVGTGMMVSLALPEMLGILGWTADGVGLGSFAARWQSIIGNVEKGSAFAFLQSVAMAGISDFPFVVIAAVSGGTGIAFAVEKLCSSPHEWSRVG